MLMDRWRNEVDIGVGNSKLSKMRIVDLMSTFVEEITHRT
jgi:hypothetical protein